MNRCSAPVTLGRQTFDGLGRQLSVECGARVTNSHYIADQLAPSHNILADGQRLDFSYVRELEHMIQQIKPANEAAHTLTYEPRLALLSSTTSELGAVSNTYGASGTPLSSTWSHDGKDYVTQWRYSLGGVLLGFTDAAGIEHDYLYEPDGRLRAVNAGTVSGQITYDDFSRPISYTTDDSLSGRQLTQTLSYDSLGREHTRTSASATDSHVQTLTYNDLDQVVCRHWQHGTTQGSERFSYDRLGRLLSYTAEPDVAPRDPFGNTVVGQAFVLNLFDGYTSVTSHFAGGDSDLATYHYDNPDDPTQVSRISHTHPSWPPLISLSYDRCGRLTHDSLGRVIHWDTQDRVTQVTYRGQACKYGYDPDGNLSDRTVDGTLSRSFHSAGQFTHEVRGQEHWHVSSMGGQLLAIDRLTAGVRQAITLLGCDAQGSVRLEAQEQLHHRRYTPHGAEYGEAAGHGQFGFAGEYREPLTGWYIPAGYRPYDPLLMIFLAPDSDSPFGGGGLNPYAYCAADPINRIDPDGHSWLTWLTIGLGIVLGVAATVATMGAAAPGFVALGGAMAGNFAAMASVSASTYAAMAATTLSAVAVASGTAGSIMEATGKDEKAASALGWISLGADVAGTVIASAPKLISKGVRFARSIGRSRKAAVVPRKTSQPVLIFERKLDKQDVVFHPDFLGQGTPAFETHAWPTGWLMNSRGQMRPPGKVALEMEAWMAANGHGKDQGLNLIACAAGRSGAAQKVADTTGRTVNAYLHKIYVKPHRFNQRLMVIPETTNLPVRSRAAHVPIQFTNRPNRQLAPSRLFFPRL